MQLQKLNNEEEFIKSATTFVKDLCKNQKKKLNISLSGGNTPKPIYEALRKSDIPFERIHFYQVDERYIPKDHPESNYKLIKETLQKPFHFFDTSLPIEEALTQYEKELPEKFDLTILGIGADGHTASLFPHSPALNETTRKVAHTTTDQFTIKNRLTLTFPAIMESKILLILLKSVNKENILKELIINQENTPPNKEIMELPAKKLLTHPNLYVFYYS